MIEKLMKIKTFVVLAIGVVFTALPSISEATTPITNKTTAVFLVNGISRIVESNEASTLLNNSPFISITSPSSGDMVSGITGVGADASDDTEVDRVEFWYNFTFIASDSTNSYSCNWNTAKASDGSYTLTAIAYDTQNLSASDAILVTIDNTNPEAQITSPESGETVSGTINIEGTARDANFKEYTLAYGQRTNPSSWSTITTSTTLVSSDTLTSWDTTQIDDGIYTLKLTCEDEAANVSEDALIVIINNLAPVIAHDPVTSATYGQSLLITTAVSSECDISSVTVHYREGGKTSYTSISMSSGSDYQGTIPGSAITERGLKYYIQTEDIYGGIATSPNINPGASPYCVRVNFSSLSFSFSTLQKKWQMISVPLELDNSTPEGVLVDDLGAQDDTVWKLYHWNTANGSYDEYPSVPDFTPGNALWLITKNSKNIDVGQGTSVDTSSDYSIDLASGWTQLGCPFAFDIDWGNVKVEKDGIIKSISEATDWIRDTIWHYDGTQHVPYQAPDGTLEAWKGDWVKALVPCRLLIPPLEAGEVPLASTLFRSIEDFVQILAKVDDFKDSHNFFGLSDKAKDGYDRLDIDEAPPIAPYVSLSFPHQDWKENKGHYCQDIRKAPNKKKTYSEKIIWDMQIKTDQLNKTITLEWKNTKAIPEEYYLYLTDENESILANMRKKNTYFFGTLTGKENFKVIATAKELSSLTKDLTLTEVYNYPNPANDTTNIHFKLGADANVTIRIYTISGELVTTLVENKTYVFGVHDGQSESELQWNTTNDIGCSVASGVYILLVEAKNSAKRLIKTNKIAVIK